MILLVRPSQMLIHVIPVKKIINFKANRSDVILHNEKCFNSLPDSHFFYFGGKIKDKNRNEIIQSINEPCYDTCLSCYSKGSQKENACSECKDDLISYDLVDINVQETTINTWKLNYFGHLMKIMK